MNKYTTKEFEQSLIEACNNSLSMAEACSKVGMHFNTFKKHAERLGVYNSNQSGKGISKFMPKIPLDDIIKHNKYPQYPTYKLKIRMIKENVKQHQCESCGLKEWLKNPIPLELDHIDGNRFNHHITNLRLLCPNCHALTPTYRGKNSKYIV